MKVSAEERSRMSQLLEGHIENGKPVPGLLRLIDDGEISAKHIKWFMSLSDTDRDMHAAGLCIPKFVLYQDLGILVVPLDYDHEEAIQAREGPREEFEAQCRKEGVGYQPIFSSSRYLSNIHRTRPTYILKPGDRFKVRVFKQLPEKASIQEYIRFLDIEGAVHLGAQGLFFVYTQACEQERDPMQGRNWFYPGHRYYSYGYHINSEGDGTVVYESCIRRCTGEEYDYDNFFHARERSETEINHGPVYFFCFTLDTSS